MITEVSLGVIDGVEHRLIASNKEEIDAIVDDINNKRFDEGVEYKIHQVIAYGDPTKISEHQCAQYIQSVQRRPPATSPTDLKRQTYYYCEAVLKSKYSKDPFTLFSSAKAAWNSAVQLMNYPYHVILVKIPIKDDNTTNNNT